MQFRLVLLGAYAIFANVGIIAPAATAQHFLFANGSADGAGFQHVRDDVPGIASPSVQDLTFFANLLEFVVAQHNPLLPTHSLRCKQRAMKQTANSK
jgi:hypothetical protein